MRTWSRVPKTYPAYFGTYNRFDEIATLDSTGFDNLFLVGRNGMHKYNNQDHSHADGDDCGRWHRRRHTSTRAALWAINTEQEYHEEKK